jgi:hypothetical protein
MGASKSPPTTASIIPYSKVGLRRREYACNRYCSTRDEGYTRLTGILSRPLRMLRSDFYETFRDMGSKFIKCMD